MLYRKVLSCLIDGELFFLKGKLYKFNNKYSSEWLNDELDTIDDERFIEILRSNDLIGGEGPSCKIIKNSLFKKLHIQITTACMCKCPHCYVGEKKPQNMNLETFCAIIDEAIDSGVFCVDYSGGEPTLHPNFTQMIEYGKKSGLYQMLFTNGYIKKDLFPVIDKNIDVIQISIDGVSSYHNSFRKTDRLYEHAIETLEFFKDHEIKKIISMSLVKENVEYIEDVYNVAQKYNARFRLSPPSPVGNFEKIQADYYKELVDNTEKFCFEKKLVLPELNYTKPGCSAISSMLYVDVNQDIYPCPLLSFPDYNLGNFKTTTFCDIINSKKAINIKKEISRLGNENKKYRFFCPSFFDKNDKSQVFWGEQK